MIKKLTLLLLVCNIWISTNTNAQTNTINYTEIKTIQKIVDKYYVQKINTDTLAARTFTNFISVLCNGMPVLTQQEYSELAKTKFDFATNLSTENSTYFLNITKQIADRKKSINQYISNQSNYAALPTSNLQCKIQQQGTYINGTEKEVLNYFLHLVQLDMLYTSTKFYYNQDSLAATSDKKQTANLAELQTKFITKLQTKPFLGEEMDVQESICLAIASALDPHSEYMSNKQVTQFNNSLSSTTSGFGFYCSENKQKQLLVEALIPGGAAWKSNQLHEGDQIVAMQYNNEEPLELVFYNDDDVNTGLEKNIDKTLHITIKNKAGIISVVKLQQQNNINIENVFQGYCITNQNKVGYIALPSFYRNSSIGINNSSANDLAKAIIKLNKDSIEGLIVDLRNNGGGAMEQAVDIIGLFIDVGPVGISRDNSSKPIVHKDMNRGIVFDKPLIILVNQFSASASEFLAAALQDYGRAIIVGQTTYGKATMQTILPADDGVLNIETYKPQKSSSAIKLTVGKLYRITGNSIQCKGVVPDVPLPNWLAGLQLSEAESAYALPNDTVLKKTYYTPSTINQLGTIQSNSKARIDANNAIKKLGDKYTKAVLQNKQLEYPINKNAFYNYYYKNEKANADMQLDKVQLLDIKINTQDANALKADAFAEKISKNEVDNLQHDVLLQETYLIMKDFLHLQK
jgi:carboxyl-terminal processing protease